MKKNLLLIFVISFSISGCMVGPNFQKPVVEAPAYFHYDSTRTDTVLNLSWWTLFNDQNLENLIDSALKNNKDVRIAASRVEEARLVLGYTKADQYPSVNYSGNGQRTNIDLSGNSGNTVNSFSALGNLSWEIDFWGKYRRAAEAARADLLATEYAQRAVMISLISEVAHGYFTLLDYHSRLEISRQTLQTRQEGLNIMKDKFKHGVIPELDLNQAEIQEAIAAAAIPFYERLVAKTEHTLSILLGQNPGQLTEINTLKNIETPPSIPAGLPSNLLERRPDILVAEQQLAAQNARIGVAQAMRFPSISLTGVLGLASGDLSTILSSNSLGWSLQGGLVGPIFNFGKNKRRVEIEKHRTEQAGLNYEKSVLQAFREVEDALVEIYTFNNELVSRKRQLNAAESASGLSGERYNGGVTSYLEVLDSERSLFNAQLSTSETYQQHLNAYVNLYKALGGGWISKEEKDKSGTLK